VARSTLENRAKKLLTDFDSACERKTLENRPFIIELFGTPKAGKTTIKEMLKHFFKRQGWSVSTPTEGAEIVEWTKRREPDYNFQTGEYALTRARELCYGPLHKTFHVAIFDRAILDVVTRMDYYQEKGVISPAERKTFVDYYLAPHNRTMFDCHICMVSTPEVAIERELARALTKKHGETMNLKVLTDLLQSHQNIWDLLGGTKLMNIGWHDSSLETEEQTAKAVLDLVLKSFERRIKLSK